MFRYTAAQAKFLRSLGPTYRKALEENNKELFFEQVYLLWFDRFPEPRPMNMDRDEYACNLQFRKKVSP